MRFNTAQEAIQYELQILEAVGEIELDRLRELADAERKGKIKIGSDWTPCAEGLPEKVDKRLWSRDVLATIKQKTGNCFVVVAYYHYGHEQWKTDDMTDNDAIDVLAWQPLPEPYNPDRKEDAKSDDVSQWPEWKQRAALSNYDFKKEDSE